MSAGGQVTVASRRGVDPVDRTSRVTRSYLHVQSGTCRYLDIVAVQCGPAGGAGPGEAVLLLHLPGARGVLVLAAPL